MKCYCSLSLPVALFSVLGKLQSGNKEGKGTSAAGFARAHQQLCAL